LVLDGSPTSVDQERIYAMVVGAIGQSGGLERGLEAGLQLFSPNIGLREWHLASFDREQSFSLIADIDADRAFTQYVRAGKQQSNLVHHVFPLYAALIANVGLHLLELRGDVSRIGLEHELRQKCVSHGEKFSDERSDVFNDWEMEALQYVRVRLEREHDELLPLPIHFLGFVGFELLGHTVQRPLQFRRWQIATSPVSVRCINFQA
jgi:hypothetical protein